MAKDYFQDIIPPNDARRAQQRPVPPPARRPASEPEPHYEAAYTEPAEGAGAGRSIRDIPPSSTRMRLSGEPVRPQQSHVSRKIFPWYVWLIAGLVLIGLIALGLSMFRSTSIEVTPRSQQVTFDRSTSKFMAYPAAIAASGTLPYVVFTSSMDDSALVPARGMKHVETKASGSITVYNDYSASSVKLLKNTRFESNGLVFRIPNEAVVPGKKGATAGSIKLIVFADEAGGQYNIQPTRFTLPGLQNNSPMYSGVYAISEIPFTGGFLGEQPDMDSTALSAAVSTLRSKLSEKVRQSLQLKEGYVSFTDLVLVQFESLPSSPGTDGNVSIREKANVRIIAFPTDVFSNLLARSVIADADTASVRLVPGADFSAKMTNAAFDIGNEPFELSLGGSTQVIWNVDPEDLSKALAGKDQSAFNTIVNGFPSIQEAHAKIEPFWKSTFPSDPASIMVKVLPPKES